MFTSSCLLLISPGGGFCWGPSPGGSAPEWLEVASSLEQRAEQLGEGMRNRRLSQRVMGHGPICPLGSES